MIDALDMMILRFDLIALRNSAFQIRIVQYRVHMIDIDARWSRTIRLKRLLILKRNLKITLSVFIALKNLQNFYVD